MFNEPSIKLILAQDVGYGIGYKGKLPWEHEPCKDDMKMFQSLTTGVDIPDDSIGNAVIMGYNTWISIPEKRRPLKNRTNIVLTNAHYGEMLDDTNCDFVFSCWAEVISHIALSNYNEVWVIGGAEIYRGAIEHMSVSKVFVTTLKKKYQCDRYINIRGLLLGAGYDVSSELIRETDEYTMELITCSRNRW